MSSKDGPWWKVDVKYGLHNHNLPDRLEGHVFADQVTPNTIEKGELC